MEVSDTQINQFENKFWSLKNQFLLSIDNYRRILEQQYLEGKDGTDESQASQTQLNNILGKTFLLYSQINSNIIANNKTIESLDEYLDRLKLEVDIENSILDKTRNTQQAAVPREEQIRENAQENYATAAYYVVAVLGASVAIYRYFKK
jgi:hypothetical protein